MRGDSTRNLKKDRHREDKDTDHQATVYDEGAANGEI